MKITIGLVGFKVMREMTLGSTLRPVRVIESPPLLKKQTKSTHFKYLNRSLTPKGFRSRSWTRNFSKQPIRLLNRPVTDLYFTVRKAITYPLLVTGMGEKSCALYPCCPYLKTKDGRKLLKIAPELADLTIDGLTEKIIAWLSFNGHIPNLAMSQRPAPISERNFLQKIDNARNSLKGLLGTGNGENEQKKWVYFYALHLNPVYMAQAPLQPYKYEFLFPSYVGAFDPYTAARQKVSFYLGSLKP